MGISVRHFVLVVSLSFTSGLDSTIMKVLLLVALSLSAVFGDGHEEDEMPMPGMGSMMPGMGSMFPGMGSGMGSGMHDMHDMCCHHKQISGDPEFDGEYYFVGYLPPMKAWKLGCDSPCKYVKLDHDHNLDGPQFCMKMNDYGYSYCMDDEHHGSGSGSEDMEPY